MFSGHQRGAILSLAAHATCACHFSLTIRCQNKALRGCYHFSFPHHTGHSSFGKTLALGPKPRSTTYLLTGSTT